MRIEDGIKLDYSDVLFRPKRSTLESRQEVVLEREYKFHNSAVVYKGIPIMAANMDTIGTFSVANALHQSSMFTCLHKHYSVEDWQFNYRSEFSSSVAVSTGTSESDLTKLNEVLLTFPAISYICVDVANGYSEKFVKFVADIKNLYPDKVIIAGNVVTSDMTQELILAGASVVKVGIGSGSACLTRKITGVGYPQLSAVIECADAAHGLGGHIIADGGCTCPGDVAKAFGAGADFVMLGGMFAGYDETGTDFYGMSSYTAQSKYSKDLANYRASEGRTISISNKGPLQNIIKEVTGGLRSTCTYVGAATLKDLSKCTTFIRVNNQLNRSFENNTIGN